MEQENIDKEEKIIKMVNFLQSDELDNNFFNLQKRFSKLLREQMKNLINFSTPYNIKNVKNADLSQKIKKKFIDKCFTINFFNFTIADFLDKTEDCIAEEIINEIYSICFIKKTLDFYHNKSFQDFFKRNLKEEKEFTISEKLKYFYFEHKIINNLETIDYFKLKHLLEGPLQLRRHIDKEYGYYRYIPILCKNYCENNFDNFYQNLSTQQKQKLEDNEKELYYEIKTWFLKNCIFAHNYNEINYHPFKFMTRFCKIKSCSIKGCHYAHFKEELVLNFNLGQFSEILKELNEILKNKKLPLINKQLHSEIIKKYNGFDIFTYKVFICKENQLCVDIKNCNFFHNLLERRRDPNKNFIKFNKPCEDVFINEKWTDPLKCKKGDRCEYFHTRNELFYDFRNFRKIYECPYEKNDNKCPHYFTCCYKHSIDININELYLPESKRETIKDLINQNKLYENEIDKMNNRIQENKLKCNNCKGYMKNKMAVLKCGHNFCEKCIGHMRMCSFKCIERKNNLINDVDYILLELKIKENLIESILICPEDEREDLNDFYEIQDEENILDFSIISKNLEI